MTYVLQRVPDGWFVAPPGSPRSYTKKLSQARRFPDRGAALVEACGNERAVPYEEAMEP